MEEKVIITGATSGIGYATALLFLSKGIKVVACGRNEEVGKELTKQGISFIRSDISDPSSVKEMIETVAPFSYAINNAGIEGKLGPIADLSEKEFDEVIDINLKGLWLCMKYQIQVMKALKKGSIINISTNLTKLSIPDTGVYTASKAAVEALTRIAAIENAKFGIRINSINPGAVDTPMIRRIYQGDSLEELKKMNPLGKIASPEDIAEAIYWFCSPLAGHINGASLMIDGGS